MREESVGKFETISSEGVKTYTLFSKNSFKSVLGLDKEIAAYSFYPEERDSIIEIYLDAPNNLLASAGIILSKVIESNKAYFRIEREEYQPSTRKSLLAREKKVFIHPIGIKDRVRDHSLFLIDGITSMFTTKFHIDFENILKTVEVKMEIETRRSIFKVFSGKGFKGEMDFEEVRIKNNSTHRKAELYMMMIKQTSSKMILDDFNDFTGRIEKYCKEAIPIDDSKYQIAQRLTEAVTKK